MTPQPGLVRTGKKTGFRSRAPRQKAATSLTKDDLERIAEENPNAKAQVDARGHVKLVTYFLPELVAEHEREKAALAKAAEARPRDEDSTPSEPTTQVATGSSAASRQPQVPMRRIAHFPEWLGHELIEACLDASYQIRHERQVAYERAVVLESPYAELTLLPIKGTGPRLRVPFHVRRTTGPLRGELLLGEAGEPLPAMVDADADRDIAVGGWACALLGFAAVTCFEVEPPEPRIPQQYRSAARSFNPQSARGPVQTRTVPRRRAWPAHLEPIGRWVRYRGSFVSGHRRCLLDGRVPSAKARERAADVGIVLRPYETWVRPHARGIPEDVEMRFRWRAPKALAEPGQNPT